MPASLAGLVALYTKRVFCYAAGSPCSLEFRAWRQARWMAGTDSKEWSIFPPPWNTKDCRLFIYSSLAISSCHPSNLSVLKMRTECERVPSTRTSESITLLNSSTPKIWLLPIHISRDSSSHVVPLFTSYAFFWDDAAGIFSSKQRVYFWTKYRFHRARSGIRRTVTKPDSDGWTGRQVAVFRQTPRIVQGIEDVWRNSLRHSN